MDFTAPLPLEDALNRLGEKGLLPSGLGSFEQRHHWSADLRQRSLFSARTTNAAYLQEVKDVVKQMLDGKIDTGKARELLLRKLDALQYRPETGFPGERPVPPAATGEIRDLSSTQRLNLVLETNMRQLANYGLAQRGSTDYARFAFPCWELTRIYLRRVPRGTDGKTEDWPSRWEQVSGEFYDGRMIARKDDPIWDALGADFPDGIDGGVPPFAFGSGFGWMEVSRRECVELGVIEPAQAVRKVDKPMPTAKASNIFDSAILNILQVGIGALMEKTGEMLVSAFTAKEAQAA